MIGVFVVRGQRVPAESLLQRKSLRFCSCTCVCIMCGRLIFYRAFGGGEDIIYIPYIQHGAE